MKKFLWKCLIHILTYIECYLLSCVYTSFIWCIVLGLISIFATIPCFIVTKFWLVLIISYIPMSIVFCIIVESGMLKKNSKADFLKEVSKSMIEINSNVSKE